MPTIKIACPDCGQKVSGDESFLGTSVNCPLCNTAIQFPKEFPDDVAGEPSKKSSAKEKAPGKSRTRDRVTNEAPPRRTPPVAPEPSAVPAKSPSAATPTPAAPSPATPSPAPVIPATGRSASPREKAPARTSGAAIWSMILGIVSLVLCPIGILFAIPAIIAGHSARSAIQSSLGRIGGQGYATTGLALGYLYAAIVFVGIVFLPWKAFVAFGEQRWNTEAAGTILEALDGYAADNGGQYPKALLDLVPDYLSPEQSEACKYVEPGSLPPERLDYEYYPGRKAGDDPKTILIFAPESDRNYQRLVGHLDGTVEILSEDDFIRKTMK